jgi:hypothetical protein
MAVQLLASIYLLNGTATQLNEAYKHESAGLDARSFHGLSRINNDEKLREHLGDIAWGFSLESHVLGFLTQT